jgi:hypothetical protein
VYYNVLYIVFFSGHFVLAWKKGIAILTAGITKVTPEERIRIVEGYNLEIRNAQINDAGNYICQIGTLDPVELKHTLQILSKYNHSLYILYITLHTELRT